MQFNPSELSVESIYSKEEGGFVYSLPEDILRRMFSGRAFDYKKEYTEEESKNLYFDIAAIFEEMMRENPIKAKIAFITAGGPGAGKTTLLEQDRAREIKRERTIAYIDPDAVCLKKQKKTYLAELEQEIEKAESASIFPFDLQDAVKQIRVDQYTKWRPASNAACHLILAHLIRSEFAFYYGTTATSPQTGFFLKFLKERGYSIRLIHLTAPDDVRWRSIQERDKTFVQTTEADIVSKGKWLHDRIMDTYLKFADHIEFYYRDKWDEDAKLSATWIRHEEPGATSGTLEVLNPGGYAAIKGIHNDYCRTTGKEDLLWEATVEKRSAG